MEIEVKKFKGVAVVNLSGSLDQDTYERVNETLQELSTPGKDIIMDLTGVKFVSSSGFRILFQTQKALAEKNRKLILVGLNERIWNALDLVGLSGSFNILDTTSEALRTLPYSDLPEDPTTDAPPPKD
ncbi:MAG TPA: STAS domain-containing protein [Anaerolineales bacterium]|nr:STAS domain-containing protein [Anaerolineales bacterium]